MVGIENKILLAQEIIAVFINAYETILDREGKIATKQTIQSLLGESVVKEGSINIKITAAIFLFYIEFGRRAGAKMPPEGALDDWYSAKGIDPKLDFVIRRAIARKGIKPTPITEFVLDAVRDDLERLYNRYLDNEVASLTARIRTQFKRI